MAFCSEECQSNKPIHIIDNRYDIQFKSIVNRNTEAFICWQDREFGHSSQYLIIINDGGNRRSLSISGYCEMDILVFYANEAIKWFRRPSYGQTFDTYSSTLSMFISYAGCGRWRIRLGTKDSFFAYLFDHKAYAVNNKSIKPLKWEDLLALDSKKLKIKRKRNRILVGSINDINIYLSEDALIATLTALSKFSCYDDQSQVALIASSTTYDNIE